MSYYWFIRYTLFRYVFEFLFYQLISKCFLLLWQTVLFDEQFSLRGYSNVFFRKVSVVVMEKYRQLIIEGCQGYIHSNMTLEK